MDEGLSTDSKGPVAWSPLAALVAQLRDRNGATMLREEDGGVGSVKRTEG